MPTRTITITQAKATLLQLVDDIGESGDEIVITRRGRPVAKITTVIGSHPLRGALVMPDDLSQLWSAGDDDIDPVEKFDRNQRALGGHRPGAGNGGTRG